MIDDLTLKNKCPNHLATRLEKQAAAGAKLPKKLTKRLTHLQELTDLARPILATFIGDELAHLCHIVHTDDDTLTLSLPNITAVNHLRYLKHDCLMALREHEAFGIFGDIRLLVQSNLSHHTTKNHSTKKPLSENTRRTITHYAELVISQDKLKQSLINLANHIQLSDENTS